MSTSKKLQPQADQAKIIQNKVHQLIESIESYFRDEGRIKKDFATAALTGAIRFIDEISETDGLSTKKKVDALTRIYQAANARIEKLAVEEDPIPLAYWAKRTDPSISPCDFVIANYPTYGRGLTQAAVRRVDRPLYQALHRVKNRDGWPEGFILPALKDANDVMVSKVRSKGLKGLDELSPVLRKKA